MNEHATDKLNKLVLYSIIYTVIFISIGLLMPYIEPFVIGAIIAFISQPIIKFFTNKFKIKRGISSFVTVSIIFIIISAIITIIIVNIVNELISLSTLMPNFIESIKVEGYKFIDMVAAYSKNIDPTIIESIKSTSNKLFSGSFTAALFIMNFLLRLIKSLPQFFMVVLFTLLTSFYVSFDFPMLKDKLFSVFTKEDSSKAKNIILQANKMIGNYIKAYIILITMTFVETYIGTSILGVKYALILSLVTSISDLLPILGPGTILVPTSIGFLIAGNYVKGFGILIIYLIITIIRQILEPKIVSASLGIYPLAILIAIFIGLKAYGFIGMIFAVFYIVFYVVFNKVGVFS